MKTVIGLCGKSGSGKSTTAAKLNEYVGTEIISFATPLKQQAQNIQTNFGLNIEKDRELLQFLGKHIRKAAQYQEKPDPICTIALNKICNSEMNVVVLDDLRMIKEFEMLMNADKEGRFCFLCFKLVGRQNELNEQQASDVTENEFLKIQVLETFDTSKLSPDEVAQKILEYLDFE